MVSARLQLRTLTLLQGLSVIAFRWLVNSEDSIALPSSTCDDTLMLDTMILSDLVVLAGIVICTVAPGIADVGHAPG